MYRYGVPQLVKTNILNMKFNPLQLAYLKNVTLSSKMYFHNFNFGLDLAKGY